MSPRWPGRPPAAAGRSDGAGRSAGRRDRRSTATGSRRRTRRRPAPGRSRRAGRRGPRCSECRGRFRGNRGAGTVRAVSPRGPVGGRKAGSPGGRAKGRRGPRDRGCWGPFCGDTGRAASARRGRRRSPRASAGRSARCSPNRPGLRLRGRRPPARLGRTDRPRRRPSSPRGPSPGHRRRASSSPGSLDHSVRKRFCAAQGSSWNVGSRPRDTIRSVNSHSTASRTT